MRDSVRPGVLRCVERCRAERCPKHEQRGKRLRWRTKGTAFPVAHRVERFSQGERSDAVSILFAVCACVFDLVLVLSNVQIEGRAAFGASLSNAGLERM